MSDSTAETDRKKTRAALLEALRKPRQEATEEVNWLLVTDSRQMRDEFTMASLEAETWEDSVERQLADLGDEEPITDYEIDTMREGLNASLRAARAAGQRSREAFDARRAFFAHMLLEVRQAHKVLLNDDALSAIQLLNADGYLAQALEMNQDRFTQFYGGDLALTPEASQEGQPTMQPGVSGGIDYSRSGGGGVVSASEKNRQPLQEPQRLSTVLQETALLPPEPDHDLEPGLDF
ncbi:hypothetical protein [Arthrobacter bambusae]|uniref:Uncharacterized protein n=1 Tax=Arthrobacter bambusae TaxID=1338426 RepID=A0AAW8DD23_9MICC|nr:hypothetical protein [Arthrobacter bambusae]MDP9903190.1 hypothetical protein [Arthrobacter bambusae]MDQ0128816.1 hypothetical protein [Arthrobacter bambusae]MDQ0180157.1 hypothetical protein [Arthrobacter bambusae]